VICVVKIDLGRSEKLVHVISNGLKLTKKHPIYFNNQWQYPIDIVDNNIASYCDSTSQCVYNFILDQSYVLLVNNMPCVTFGHGIKQVYHPFYATTAVLKTISSLPGFENGFVHVNGNLRNYENTSKRETIFHTTANYSIIESM